MSKNKCPVCNHKLYGEIGKKRWCKFCGYKHDPNNHGTYNLSWTDGEGKESISIK